MNFLHKLYLPFVLFIAILFCISYTGCKKEPNTENKPDNLPAFVPFAGQSIFYNPIDSAATVDPNSSVMVGSLVDQANKGFVIAHQEWTVPVYFADASTPRYDVTMTANWAPDKKLTEVPIPDWAEADPETDGHLVIVDTDGGCVYDFWEFRYSTGKFRAGWGNAMPLTSDGIFPNGFSARGSGFELLQGLIWPDELAAGQINHALIFSYDHTKAGGPVAPATESDGTSNNGWAIPEGALVQLNPALDLDALGLTGYTKTIAKCLQEYGMYCADDGGGLSLYSINPICVKNNPFAGVLPDVPLVTLDGIPADQFRVLTLPAQNGNPTIQVVSNGCNNFQ